MPNKVGREGLLKWGREEREVEIPFGTSKTKGKIRYVDNMFYLNADNGINIEIGNNDYAIMNGKEYIIKL